MKRTPLFRILALLAALLLCLTACGRSPAPAAPAPQKQPTAPESHVKEVRLESVWKQDDRKQTVEFAMITGLDSQGNTCWTYVTNQYPAAQIPAAAEVLCTDTQYIFWEDGHLISLDLSTGTVLWENRDFDGFDACGLEAPDGTLYFSGYMGTAFLAAAPDGKTLHIIPSFGNGYEWAHDLRFEGDKIAVTLDLGPDTLPPPGGFVFHVDPVDYSFALQESENTVEPLAALAGDIAQVLPMDQGAVAVLYTDGTVGVAGNDALAAETASWSHVAQLYLGTQEGTLAARMADGTAASTEYNLSGWKNLKELYVHFDGIAGLRKDGSVVTAGTWSNGSPEGWTGIRELYLDWSIWGLKTDGSLRCTDDTYYKYISSLKNVRQLLFGRYTYAVLEDGRIVSEESSESEFKQLRDAKTLTLLDGMLFGLSADGRLLAQTKDGCIYNDGDYFTLNPRPEQDSNPNIYLWDIRYQNIRSLDFQHGLIMLKFDGTVDTVNIDHFWDLSLWKGIEKITTARYGDWSDPRIYGIRADGSVIVAAADYQAPSVNMDNYLAWRVLDLYYSDAPWYTSGVVGITPEGTLVGDGDYAHTDFSVLHR